MNAKEKRPKHQRLRRFLSLVGEDGFEPSKRNATDLQSAKNTLFPLDFGY